MTRTTSLIFTALVAAPLLALVALGPAPHDPAPNQNEDVAILFDDVSVEELLPWIADTTDKTIIPVRLATLRTQKITVLTGSGLDREEMLPHVYRALRLNDIAVVERDDVIILMSMAEVVSIADVPVLGADVDLSDETTCGFVMKYFGIESADAVEVAEHVASQLPDYATLSVDQASNKIVVLGDVELCRRVRQMIEQLDRPSAAPVVSTIRLQHADAAGVADSVHELFGPDRPTQAPRTTRRQRHFIPAPRVKVTVDPRNNAVTIVGDADLIGIIETLIRNEWDRPSLPGPDS